MAYYAFTAYTVLVSGQYVPEPPVMQGDRLNRVLAIVDTTPDPILSDSIGFLAMRDRPIAIDDSFLQKVAREKGLWDNSGVIEAVRERRYPLILSYKTTNERQLRSLWGNQFVDALLANYELTGPESFTPKPR